MHPIDLFGLPAGLLIVASVAQLGWARWRLTVAKRAARADRAGWLAAVWSDVVDVAEAR